MRLNQFKYLINLDPECQKRLLAFTLIEQMSLLKKALDLEGQENELGLLAGKVGELKTRLPTPKIQGLEFSLLRADIMELVTALEKTRSFRWRAKQHERTLQKLLNQQIDAIQKLVQKKGGEKKCLLN